MPKMKWYALPEFENFEGPIRELEAEVIKLRKQYGKSTRVKFDRGGSNQHLMIQLRDEEHEQRKRAESSREPDLRNPRAIGPPTETE